MTAQVLSMALPKVLPRALRRKCLPALALAAGLLLTGAAAGQDDSEELWLAVELYLAGDYEGAAEFLMPLASRGSDDARYLVVWDNRSIAKTETYRIWRARIGDVEREHALFRTWMREAADREHLGAVNWLFRTARDLPRKKAFAEIAVERGSPTAMEWLGAYYLGLFNQEHRDFDRAFALFERSLSAGSSDTAVFLGIHYLRGELLPKNLPQAKAFLESAARAGNMGALPPLARLYREGPAEDFPPPEGLKWLYLDRDKNGGDRNSEAIEIFEAEVGQEAATAARVAADEWWRGHLANLGTDLGRSKAWLQLNYPEIDWELWQIVFLADNVQCPAPRLRDKIDSSYMESPAYHICMERGLSSYGLKPS